ncbi:MAG: prepilin-type N-terminal cleavage/methylation domain-containing protein [Candidatus Omnitrophica bacterium]|nr:prepilin-type N-terminal cleavage/methylation domain-containing protein [Candidatus Omnitrophota bacterium]
MLNQKEKSGFSLVELMITVSILTVGIVIILRSFLTNTQAIDSMSNRLKSLEALSSKAAELEKQSLENNGLAEWSGQEDIAIGLRQAILSAEVAPFKIEEDEDPVLSKIKLRISWQESGKKQDMLLEAFLPLKE